MRIAIFLTGEGSPFCLENFGSYAELFIDLVSEPDTSFDVFDSQSMAFPRDTGDYDAILLTGSAADAHGDQLWIKAVEESVRAFRDAGKKIVGICFGHQAVANALGGRSGRNPNGWELGTHALELTPSFFTKPYTAGIRELEILEIHQDHVIEVPPGAEVMATSPSTPVQMYAIGDQVLCMQGHPEFNEPIVRELVETRMALGKIPSDLGEQSIESMARAPHRESLQAILKGFLNGKI